MKVKKLRKETIFFGIIVLLGVICVGCGKAISTDGKTSADIKKEYESALACMKEGNYEEALSILELIPTTYKDYEEVAEQKKQAEVAYVEELLNTVELKVLGKQYADAIALLDSKLEIVGENAELIKKRVEIVELCKENYFTEAEKYASIEDYSNALEQLQQLVNVLGKDADTEIKIMNYKVAQIIMTVKEFEEKEDYATAIEYIQEQLPEVNNNAELTKKMEELMVLHEIKENQPVTPDGKTNADLRKEYEEAVAYMEKGEYESAIKRFDTISRNYKDYDEVIEKRANAVQEYVADAINRADELAANGSYEEALVLLDERCDFLGEESKLDVKIEELMVLCKKAYLVEAETYATSEDYVTGICMRFLLDI